MAKKLSDIEKLIQKSSNNFFLHLNRILPQEVWNFLSEVQSKTNIYLFSGVIRNYFINKKFEKLRDIDFIIEDELDIISMFPTLDINRNSFGGYKININGLFIDLWVIKDTWGLNYGQLKLAFNQIQHLPNTTFFNFSSILYSLNNKEFIIGKPFLKFLKERKIDVVLEENPFPSLCIVNSFYYSEKYKIKISEKLKSYLYNNYQNNIEKFEETQMKHFGEIIYEKNELLKRINKLNPA